MLKKLLIGATFSTHLLFAAAVLEEGDAYEGNVEESYGAALANPENHGGLCEELARRELLKIFPEETHSVMLNIIYFPSKQIHADFFLDAPSPWSRYFGVVRNRKKSPYKPQELDLIVIEKGTNLLKSIAEVKCRPRNKKKAALREARKTEMIFRATCLSGYECVYASRSDRRKIPLVLPDHPEKIPFQLISYRGAGSDFDIELELDLTEIKSLFQHLKSKL